MRTPIKTFLTFFILVFMVTGLSLAENNAEAITLSPSEEFPEVQQIKTLLDTPEDEIDFAKAKLTIDKIIDPSIDVDATIKRIDLMVGNVNRMLLMASLQGREINDWEKMLALRTYLYNKGSWNQHQVFTYDHEDPFGKKSGSMLLPNYLDGHKGNCVSMPILLMIMGDRMGLKMTLSTAPNHYFVKFADKEAGITHNIEATSGGKPARRVYIKEQFAIQDIALENGIYLETLTRKETVAAMAHSLFYHFASIGKWGKNIPLADLLLSHYPKDIGALTTKASAFGHMIETNFKQKYPNPRDIPIEYRALYQHLDRLNFDLFAKAEALGWREPGEYPAPKQDQKGN